MGILFSKNLGERQLLLEAPPVVEKVTAPVPKRKLPENRYEWTEKILGEGEQSVVHFASSKDNGQDVAIKRIAPSQLTPMLVRQLCKEARILNIVSRIPARPFVKLVEGFIDHKGGICLVTNRIPGSEMFKAIIRNPKGLPEGEAKHYIYQILQAVAVLHKNDIAHLDLKLENIMYSRKTRLISIIDFGFAEETVSVDTLTGERTPRLLDSFCGTLEYTAPEILQHKEYDGKRADVWSLGVIAFALLTGSLPFESTKRNILEEKIITVKYKIPDSVSSTANTFINQMLQKFPDNRSNVSSLLKHSWFAEISDPDELIMQNRL